MGRRKLIEKQPRDENDTRTPHERFSDFAKKVLSVPKSEIDKREKAWKKAKS